MAATIGLYNRKGGVGKTFSAINIGACLAAKGKRVLIIEGDSQCNLSWFFFSDNEQYYKYGEIDEENNATLLNVLQGDNIYNSINEIEYSAKRKFLNKFQTMNIKLSVIMCGKSIDEYEPGAIDELRNALEAIQNDYDYILIDFPPVISNLTIVYLIGCDYVLVPSELAEDEGGSGYSDILRVVSKLQANVHPDLKILGLFHNKVMEYKSDQKKNLSEAREYSEGLALFNTFIHFDYGSKKKSKEIHKPLCICAPHSQAAKDFNDLTDEILQKLGDI